MPSFHYKVHQSPRNHDGFDDLFAFEEFWHAFEVSGKLLQLRLRAVGWYGDFSSKLAIDLERDFDLCGF